VSEDRLGAARPEDQRWARRRIVVATADTLTARMAGPAIRATRLAGALAAEHDVRLITTARADITDARFEVRAVDDRGLRRAMEWCDVFVMQGWILAGRPFLTTSSKVIVADIYDPLHLEQLEAGRDGGDDGRWQAVLDATAVLNEQLLRGDLFLCASAKQRDFWLGQLAALGRVNPATYDEDETLRSRLAIVPFGVSDDPPVRGAPALRGVVPGIGPHDKVVLWGGGIYNWFDPLTLIRAVDGLRHEMPDVRLVFMGLRHPNPDVGEMKMAVAARLLSRDLGLTGVHVFFNEGWVPYDERQNYLLDADVGVSTHLDHVETEFSFRTRILDYLWAGLPIVATRGDSLSDLVAQRDLGITVPAGDVDALRRALAELLGNEALAAGCRANIEVLVPELVWSKVLAPVVEFCRHPTRAPDVVDPAHGHLVGLRAGITRDQGARADLRLAVHYLREGGVGLLARRVRSRLTHRFGRAGPQA